MTKTDRMIRSAISGLLAMGVFGVALEAQADQTEKCFGVAKKGQNDCGTSEHACSHHAAKDNDPYEWVYVPEGTCEKLGGKLTAAEGKEEKAK